MIRLAQKKGFLWLSIALLILMAACAEATEEANSEVALLPTQQNTPTPALTDQTEPDEPTPAEIAAPEEAVVDECLTCHLDKQSLIDTAALEVVVESESEGEG